MTDNLFGEVVEGIKKTAGGVVKQAVKAPLDVLETATKQVSGQNNPAGSDEANKKNTSVSNQLTQMTQQDNQHRQENIAEIRRNLAEMMQPQQKPQQDIPAYISGQPGFSEEKMKQQQNAAEGSKKELPPLDQQWNAMKNKGTKEILPGAS